MTGPLAVTAVSPTHRTVTVRARLLAACTAAVDVQAEHDAARRVFMSPGFPQRVRLIAACRLSETGVALARLNRAVCALRTVGSGAEDAAH